MSWYKIGCYAYVASLKRQVSITVHKLVVYDYMTEALKKLLMLTQGFLFCGEGHRGTCRGRK